MAMPILNFFVQDRSKRIDHSHISMNEDTNSRLGLGVKKKIESYEKVHQV